MWSSNTNSELLWKISTVSTWWSSRLIEEFRRPVSYAFCFSCRQISEPKLPWETMTAASVSKFMLCGPATRLTVMNRFELSIYIIILIPSLFLGSPGKSLHNEVQNSKRTVLFPVFPQRIISESVGLWRVVFLSKVVPCDNLHSLIDESLRRWLGEAYPDPD